MTAKHAVPLNAHRSELLIARYHAEDAQLRQHTAGGVHWEHEGGGQAQYCKPLTFVRQPLQREELSTLRSCGDFD